MSNTDKTAGAEGAEVVAAAAQAEPTLAVYVGTRSLTH